MLRLAAISILLAFLTQHAGAWTSLTAIGYDEIGASVTDGAGNLYVGGSFRRIGGVAALRVAMWNGTSWLPLGSGIGGDETSGGWVAALALAQDGTLYAGGSFHFVTDDGVVARNIAKWSGGKWSALGPEESAKIGDISALAVGDGGLYAGGDLGYLADGELLQFVAHWDGEKWSPLGSGLQSASSFGKVNALHYESDGTLYVGGIFEIAGSVSAHNIARWRNGSWSPLGSGVKSDRGRYLATVHTIVKHGGEVIVGGDFSHAGGKIVNSIARWHPQSGWSALGTGLTTSFDTPAAVRSLSSSRDRIYAGSGLGGTGFKIDGKSSLIAMWKDGTWTDVGDYAKNKPSINRVLGASLTSVFAKGQSPHGIYVRAHANLPRSTALQRLVVKGHKLKPRFEPKTLNYSVAVSSKTKSVTLQPVAAAGSVTITVNGVKVRDGAWSKPIMLKPKRTLVSIIIKNSSGKSTTYKLVIQKP